ncbi:MAG TPA: DUF3826 domain-containing protein [Sedimentisphaerales bacterium]|nr:DUF3826 domain-containing protein [Sedimentisphaerales bacterium]
MTRQISITALGLAILLFASDLHAETAAEVASRTQAAIAAGNPPAWMSPTLPEDIQTCVRDRGRDLAQRLNLGDAAKETKVADLMAEHFGRVWAWQQQVGEKLEAGWTAWEGARGDPNGKDELRAATIMVEQIDPIYAEFTPQIQGLLKALRQHLSEEQVIAILDRITRSPGVDRTHNAYLEMVPEMTEEERLIIRRRLEQARVDSLAAWRNSEIVRIFKKYKVRNEFSIDYFGYNYRERYNAWFRRSRARWEAEARAREQAQANQANEPNQPAR